MDAAGSEFDSDQVGQEHATPGAGQTTAARVSGTNAVQAPPEKKVLRLEPQHLCLACLYCLKYRKDKVIWSSNTVKWRTIDS